MEPPSLPSPLPASASSMSSNDDISSSLLVNISSLDLGFEPWDPKISPAYRWVLTVQTILEPIIIFFGILCNSLATKAFLTKRLRSTSCCLYLAAKCINDTVFLTALFVVWLYRVHAPILNNTGICQTTVFITYASSFMSVWLIVLVSHENHVRISRPHQVKIYCNPRRAFINILIVLISSAIIYNFHLWTTKVLRDDNGEMMCMALVRYHELLVIINILDLVFTLIIPVLLVAGLTLVTLFAVVQAVKRKNRLHESLIGHGRPDGEQFQTVEVKVAKFLTIVSLTLIVLHSPSHVIRLRVLVVSLVEAGPPSDLINSLQRIFEIMYYLNFSANLLIFISAGENFRRTFLKMFSFYTSRRSSSPLVGTDGDQAIVESDFKPTEMTVVNRAFEDISSSQEEDCENTCRGL